MDNKNYGIALVIMIPLAIGLFFYGIFSFKPSTSTDEKNNFPIVDVEYDDDDSVEYLDLDDNDLKKNISMIFSDNSNIYIRNGSSVDDLFYKNKKTTVIDLNDSEKLMIAFKYLESNSNKKYNEISYDELNEAFINVFGKNIKFVPTDFKNICKKYEYDKEKEKFILNDEDTCKAVAGGSMSRAYQVSKKNDVGKKYIDVYEYYAKEVYSEDSLSVNYYSDYSEKSVIVNNSDEAFDIDKLIELYKNKLGIYKYRFVLEKDNYVFESVEKIK